MVRQLEREVIQKYSWLERANITSGYGVNLLFDFADLDELCKDIEGELDSKSIGAGFLSQGQRIDEFAEHRSSLLTYINDILYDIDNYLEDPLYKGFNEAVDIMATIDMTDGKTDNTLGVQKNVNVNGGGRGYGFEVEMPELNLEDFIGSRYEETEGGSYERSTYNQKVDDFVDLFAKDYEDLVDNGKIDSDERSLQEYLDSLILREFAHKKDSPFWKELLEQLSDLTIVIPIYEAATGKTLITGDYLTDTEGAFKLVSATVSLVTLGQGALAGKGGVAFAKMFAAEVVSEAAAGTTVIVCDKAGVPSAVTISLALLLGTTAGMAANKALLPEDFSKWMTKEEASRYSRYWSDVQGRQGLNDYNYYGTLGDSYYKDLTVNGKYKDFDFSSFEGSGSSGSKINPLDDPNIAKDVVTDPNAVYGYKPKEGSSLDQFDIDWSNSDEVDKARAARLEYLEAMEAKKTKLSVEVDNYLTEGKSMSEIAEMKVNQRNIDRINSYIERRDYGNLEKLYERNLLEYGQKEGPTVQQLYEKYGSYEDVIYSSVKVNKGMNVILGIEN
ncbi:MAG: ADP-ribosylating toxin-like protein [Anaerocolumna sp.]|jgi:hypothetical protein|nr:ADP-ribosylating toxin-like protein [Anaerocolumna sp.]